MAKEKNIEELLWYQKSVQNNIKLVLVGDGPYRTTLEEKAKEYQVTDSVIFTGMVSPDIIRLEIFSSAHQQAKHRV